MRLLPSVKSSVPVHAAWRTRPGTGRSAMRRHTPLPGSKAAPSKRDWYWSMINPPTTITSRPVQTAFGSPRVASGPESTTFQWPVLPGAAGGAAGAELVVVVASRGIVVLGIGEGAADVGVALVSGGAVV